MTFEQHCEESRRLFGKPFEEVYFGWMISCGKGLVRSIADFGEEGDKSARQHIIFDLKEEGWSENDPFPRDEEHYMKMGLF